MEGEMLIMGIILAILISAGMLFLFNWLMGYRKGHIRIDFDERYFKEKEHIEAIRTELEKQGKEVHYQGNGHFIIDGESYLFIERTVNMGGVPMQRTILQPIKK
ncbi:hypothetical protein AAEO50_10615 [Rossellomorea oryzaecorticis]|uniref:Uncharacterized protein n=1 Tax=Rossellomorea oryzaecorticis TaxID=1396505 RepID=A0ABU9K9L9_9BACI